MVTAFDGTSSTGAAGMTDRIDVPPQLVAELRSPCVALPDAYDEDAHLHHRTEA